MPKSRKAGLPFVHFIILAVFGREVSEGEINLNLSYQMWKSSFLLGTAWRPVSATIS